MSFDYETGIPVGYYDDVFEKRHGVQSKWHHLKFARIAELVGSGGVLVDVGCGPGTFSQCVASSINYIGLDLSEAQIRYARTKYTSPNRSFRVSSAERWAIEDGSADTVTMIEILEHLTKEQVAFTLSEAKRILKPNGRLIATTPNYASHWCILEKLINRFGRVSYEDQHINKYVSKRFRTEVERSGFEKVRVSTHLMSAPFWAMASWQLATVIDRIERQLRYLNFGAILILTAQKPTALNLSPRRCRTG